MRYKDAVLEELNEFNVVQPGRFNYQATLGSSHVPTAVFVHCLDAAGCDTIRLKAYGQEMPMLDEFMQTERADVHHGRLYLSQILSLGMSANAMALHLRRSENALKKAIAYRTNLTRPHFADPPTVDAKN